MLHKSTVHANDVMVAQFVFLFLARSIFRETSTEVDVETVSYGKKIACETADISRRHHWFPGEMTSEKRAQKFHIDDASLPRSA